ncbi:hypothetical protein MPSEU_000242800 [Mayamaea pseudoterrestris]|nr:hypothetical protein MPSEU_000242800 [Mayamaea pseudoterrestris]
MLISFALFSLAFLSTWSPSKALPHQGSETVGAGPLKSPLDNPAKETLQHMFREFFHVDLNLSMGIDGQLSKAESQQLQSSMSYAYALSMSHNEPDGLDVSTPLLLTYAPTPAAVANEPKTAAMQSGTSDEASLGGTRNMTPGAIASLTLLVASALVVAGVLIHRHRPRGSHASSSTSGETDIIGAEA